MHKEIIEVKEMSVFVWTWPVINEDWTVVYKYGF